MKTSNMKVAVGVLGLLLASTSAYAQQAGNTSVSAGGAVALSAPTGFVTGGQVQVQGTGVGTVTLARNFAEVNLVSGAQADAGSINTNGSLKDAPTAQSQMVSSFAFDRSVETGAALVGIGQVVAQGESLGGVGVVGTSSADASRAGASTTGGAFNSSSETNATGSLVGEFSTASTMQLLGQGTGFAAAQELLVGERTQGISAGLTGSVSGEGLSVNLNNLAFDFEGTEDSALPVATAVGSSSGSPTGFGFGMRTILTGDGNEIEISVANAGQGSVLVSGTTGGFFGTGTAAGANAISTPGFASLP